MEAQHLELIEQLGITLQLPALNEAEVQKASYLIIRHGYSEYNYKDQVLAKEHGEHSEVFKALKLDTTMMDPGLHAIGIKQCESN